MSTSQGVARCDWRTIFAATDDAPEELTTALDEHFRHYCPAPDCPKCEKALMFTWGLVHGEGHCANCGWPATGHHFIKDKAGKELASLRFFPLAVHPDFVTSKKKEAV